MRSGRPRSQVVFRVNSALQRHRGRARSGPLNHHGQPEKETTSEDEQAQAQKALEIESPQEAYVAEVICAPAPTLVFCSIPAVHHGGFSFVWARRPWLRSGLC